jgi:23S rRNA (cytidine1920-2'-O)/16S rRNA (cytidine1409-2'-O)-methyltransferase
VTRRRLDAELVRRGLVASTTEARSAVEEGSVLVAGRSADNPSSLVSTADPVEIVAPGGRFVSRGGDKLDAALGRFGIRVAGRACLDAGASTGGFTDCLLQHGAARVVAVDVGYGQLAWSLRSDQRVVVLDRANVRSLEPHDLPFVPDLVTADLSFISLRAVVPALACVSAEGADLLLLVKPQFEAEREEVESGGVVRDPIVWRRSIEGVMDAGVAVGLSAQGLTASPVLGPAGNVEFFVWACKGGAGAPPDVEAAIQEGRRIGGLA